MPPMALLPRLPGIMDSPTPCQHCQTQIPDTALEGMGRRAPAHAVQVMMDPTPRTEAREERALLPTALFRLLTGSPPPAILVTQATPAREEEVAVVEAREAEEVVEPAAAEERVVLAERAEAGALPLQASRAR